MRVRTTLVLLQLGGENGYNRKKNNDHEEYVTLDHNTAVLLHAARMQPVAIVLLLLMILSAPVHARTRTAADD